MPTWSDQSYITHFLITTNVSNITPFCMFFLYSFFIELPKVFIKEGLSVSVLADTSYSLNCYGQGLPAPVLQWSKMDGVLSKNVIPRPDGSLYFSRISSVDEGRYRCTASNDFGVVITEARLNVEGLFKLIKR